MTRSEFMDSLHRTLAGSLTSSTVNENMRYYEEYFDTQLRMGQSEEDIVAELGDPRLLAKTIIQTSRYQTQNYGSAQEYNEVYEDGSRENAQDGGNGSFSPKIYRMPGWLLLVLAVLLVFVVINIVGSVVSMFLPILIPLICVTVIIRLLRNRS